MAGQARVGQDREGQGRPGHRQDREGQGRPGHRQVHNKVNVLNIQLQTRYCTNEISACQGNMVKVKVKLRFSAPSAGIAETEQT